LEIELQRPGNDICTCAYRGVRHINLLTSGAAMHVLVYFATNTLSILELDAHFEVGPGTSCSAACDSAAQHNMENLVALSRSC